MWAGKKLCWREERLDLRSRKLLKRNFWSTIQTGATLTNSRFFRSKSSWIEKYQKTIISTNWWTNCSTPMCAMPMSNSCNRTSWNFLPILNKHWLFEKNLTIKFKIKLRISMNNMTSLLNKFICVKFRVSFSNSTLRIHSFSLISIWLYFCKSSSFISKTDKQYSKE